MHSIMADFFLIWGLYVTFTGTWDFKLIYKNMRILGNPSMDFTNCQKNKNIFNYLLKL